MPGKIVAIGLFALALSACGQRSAGTTRREEIGNEDAEARAAAERQVRADVASVKAATLEDRVTRLEVDVDELKAQIGARQDLAADLNQLGVGAAPMDPALTAAGQAVPAPAPAPAPKLPYSPVPVR